MIDRSLAPKVSMPSFLAIEHAQQVRLKNGLKVYCYAGCSEPVVKLNLVLNTGINHQQKDYVAILASALMKKGTKTKTAKEIQETLDYYGASLGFSTQLFTSSFSLNCLSEKMSHVLPLLADILCHTSFPDEEIQIEKRNALQRLKLNQEKNEFLSSVKFNEVILGKDHNCGKTVTAQMIENISQEDLLTYYNNTLNIDDSSFIILSGNIEDQTIELINKFLGSIPIKNRKEEIQKPFEPSSIREHFVSKANSVQSSIRIGTPLQLLSSDEDYLDFEILNRILGGYFGSRLMTNIREDKGYTYGIYSYVASFKTSSYFCIATEVGKEYKDKTISEISLEINRLKNELISQEELNMVKNYHKGRIMKSVDGSLRMANKLRNLLPLGLNEDYINRQLEAVEKINAKRIRTIAQNYLDFDKMYKIAIG